MVTRRRLGTGITLVWLLAATTAGAQPDIRMTVDLGTPAALRVETTYRDPVDMFPRLDGTLVFPLWIDATNVSSQPLTLDIHELTLTLGGAGGTTVALTPMDPADAERQLRDDTRMSAVLSTISRQGSRWARNPFSRHLGDARLAPQASRSGFVFFLRPGGFQFNGFMTLGTRAHGPELLATGVIRTAPRTRATAPGIPETVVTLISRLPGLSRLPDFIYGRPFEKSYALLFGVSTYDDPSRDLNGPKRDLQKMEAYLRDQGFDDVIAVSDKKVTESALKNLQAHFANKIGPGDRLLVYYAGHGQRNESGAGDLVLSPGTRVPMASFMSWVRQVRVKHLLVLLDACYSGSVIGGTSRDVFDSMDKATRERLFRLASQGSRFVITAGSANEVANEDPRWDGGLFTTGVLQALQAKAGRTRLITTHELYAGLKNFVMDEVTKHQLTAQTPLIQDLGYGGDGKKPAAVSEGEFVFVAGR